MIDLELQVAAYLSRLQDDDICGEARQSSRCVIARALGEGAIVWSGGYSTPIINKGKLSAAMEKLRIVFDSSWDEEVTKKELLDKLTHEHLSGNKFLDPAGPLFALLVPDLEG